ncbi:MAG TPA: SRPBCC family protein [Jatrophihabitans sp.]|jgi:hypothetical protein
MASTSIVIEASPGDVFAVLSDGWTYSNWVVGTSHIRAVDAKWPAVGSRLHHAVGAWPLLTRDYTEVEDLRPDSEIVLYASGSRLGAARIRITLEPNDAGCKVTLHEAPVDGPGRWLHNPVQDAVLHRRNYETLQRLRATVRRLTEPPDEDS